MVVSFGGGCGAAKPKFPVSQADVYERLTDRRRRVVDALDASHIRS